MYDQGYTMIGRWAVCSHGDLGKITGQKNAYVGYDWYDDVWVGTKFDGTPWQSHSPRILSEQDSTRLDSCKCYD